ncbi:unnamed protein product [Hermetia illucens]|uniref:Secreted protein n=1 Tax=Hermetia illucens TaxID=343691 RepID=A0A7R8V473_HERIL|nr:unnamed protein product [Hermetia illucens]
MRKEMLLAISVLCGVVTVYSTCISEEGLERQNPLGRVLHSVGCTIHRGAQRIGQGVRRGLNFLRGHHQTTPKPTPRPTTEYSIDVRGNFKEESASEKVESTTFTIESRMLFAPQRGCPKGQFLDHRNQCRG